MKTAKLREDQGGDGLRGLALPAFAQQALDDELDPAVDERVSESWIAVTATQLAADQLEEQEELIDSAIREPGRPFVGDHEFDLGYGYQWWIPAANRGDYSAIGILNQLVYVDPSARTTIVKLSANRMYGTSTEESTNRDVENVELLRAIAQHSNQASAQER